MVVVAVEEFHVQVHAGVFAKALEEVFEHRSFDTASHGRRELHVPHKTDTVAKVDAHAAQGFVHRNEVETVTFDSLLVAKAFH